MDIPMPASILDRVRQGALGAVALAMPLWPDILPALLVLLVIALLPWQRPFTGLPFASLDGSSPLPWVLLWYAIHVLGMVWSTNSNHGWFDLEVKLLAALIPILFMGAPDVWRRYRTAVLRCFLWASALTMLFLMLRAGWLFQAELRLRATGHYPDGLPYTNIFYSSYFSPWLHPSYLAMYAVFALAVSAFAVSREDRSRWSHLAEGRILPALLVVGVVLSASKIGWSALVLLAAQVLGVRWKEANVRRWLLMGALSTAAFFTVLLVSFAGMRGKITEAWAALQGTEDTAHDSSAARRLVWSSAAALIAEHPWVGSGTGDVKDELVRTYADRQYTYPLEHRLNAHSQFLQTAVALGIPAALVLLASVLVPLVFAFRRRQHLFAAFLVLTAINWSVESMLEVQAGVIFFVFFAALLTDRPQSRTGA